MDPKPHLIAFDFDSTLIRQEIIDELAVRAGKGEQVAAITRQAMEGKIRYDESLRRRVSALAGLSDADVGAVAQSVQYRPGFLELMGHLKKRGFKIAVISGTFGTVLDRLPHRELFDAVRVNDLVFKDGRLSGGCVVRVTDNKGDWLEELQQQLCIPPERTASVGDGATDVSMFKRSAFSVAFNAKPAVKAEATVALDGDALHALAPLVERAFRKKKPVPLREQTD